MSEVKKIRKRRTYQRFKTFLVKYADFLSAQTLTTLSQDVFSLMNTSVAFGSEINAGYAQESMEQALKDVIGGE